MNHHRRYLLSVARRFPKTMAVSGLGVTMLWIEAQAEFRQTTALPRSYDPQAIREYWSQRPASICSRLGRVFYELAPLAVEWQYHRKSTRTNRSTTSSSSSSSSRTKTTEDEEEQRARDLAIRLRQALTALGPAWIKAGQQLSIRPDLVPPHVLKELQQLCDSVQPVPDAVAMQDLCQELNCSIDDLNERFHNLHLVASASLGQVYKARLQQENAGDQPPVNNNVDVAIKVQRPGMVKNFSLDLYLLQTLGYCMDCFTTTFTNQAPYHQALTDTFSRGSYLELDYQHEAQSQQYFQRELKQRGCQVRIPDVYTQYTTRRVLTSQWINGTKLADSSEERIRELIPVGVELFLTQLLDIGAFHADPHPGNLLVTEQGELCLLDFGLCAKIDQESRNAMTKAIFNLIHRDYEKLIAQDTKALGFLPESFDTNEIKPLLVAVLQGGLLESGSDLHKRKRKLQEISNELNEIFFQYPFQVPPFFALITRGLGLLEGIALSGDPDFDIFRASAPYATKRALQLFGKRGLRRVNTSLLK